MFVTFGVDSSLELFTEPLIKVLFMTSSDSRTANELHVHNSEKKIEVGKTEFAPDINDDQISTSNRRQQNKNHIRVGGGGNMWLG